MNAEGAGRAPLADLPVDRTYIGRGGGRGGGGGGVGGLDTEGDERPGPEGCAGGRLDLDPHMTRVARGRGFLRKVDTPSCRSFLLPRVRARTRARDYS